MWARHSRAQQRAADPMTPRRGPEAGTNCKRQPRSPAAHRLKTAAEGHSTHQHSLTGRPSLTHGVPPLLLGHEQCSVIHNQQPPRTPGAGPRTATDLVSAARTTCGGWPPTTTRWRRWRKSSPAQPMPRPSTASICPTPGSSNFGGWWGSGLRRWPLLSSGTGQLCCATSTPHVAFWLVDRDRPDRLHARRRPARCSGPWRARELFPEPLAHTTGSLGKLRARALALHRP